MRSASQSAELATRAWSRCRSGATRPAYAEDSR